MQNQSTGGLPSNSAVQQYINPTAGKPVGYMYDNTSSPYWYMAAELVDAGDQGYTTRLQELPKELEKEGAWQREIRDDGEYGGWVWAPNVSAYSVAKPLPGATKIPVYEPPFSFTYNEKPLSEEQKFQLAASIAGAKDAKPPKETREKGTLDSNYVSSMMRKDIGLPTSFDMLKGVDPTKPDWNFGQATLYNPKASGFFEDMANFALEAAPYALMLSGGLGALGTLGAAAGTGAGAAGAGAGAIGAAGAGELATSEILSNLATQQLQEQALNAAVSNALGGSFLSEAALSKALDQALSGAVRGGLTSGAISALSGGDPLKAALQGAVSGGVTGGVSSLASPAVASLGLPVPIEKALTGAITGAARSAATGKDIGAGALGGGVSSGLSSLIEQIPGFTDMPAALQRAITSGAASAANSALTGGLKPGKAGTIGALLGAIDGASAQSPIAGLKGQQVAQSTDSLGSLLGLLGMAQQNQSQPTIQPPQVVGAITPYEFSSNILEDIYKPSGSNLVGTNDQLLRMARG